MLIRLAVTGLLFLSSAAHAAEWAAADTALLASALTITAVDWGQTRYIVKATESPPGYGCVNVPTCEPPSWRKHYEMNPILGREPDLQKVDRYFPIAMLGIAGLSYILPTDYRRAFLSAVIVVESAVVVNNHQIGVRIAF